MREETEAEQDVRKQRIRNTTLIPYEDSKFEWKNSGDLRREMKKAERAVDS
jgi:phenylacetate-coenzyme A ligase PaaK-like adenylate-forming protein